MAEAMQGWSPAPLCLAAGSFISLFGGAAGGGGNRWRGGVDAADRRVGRESDREG
jgi:hypothetical protein